MEEDIRNFLKVFKGDDIVKSRHSRGNGNPENSKYMKILDSCLRRNDRKLSVQTFYETIKLNLKKKEGFGHWTLVIENLFGNWNLVIGIFSISIPSPDLRDRSKALLSPISHNS